MASDLFPTTLSSAAGAWVSARLAKLKNAKASPNPDHAKFNPEYALLRRISSFRFADYPDYTCPWHLLMWPSENMRWDHVYDVVSIIESLKHVKGTVSGQSITLDPFQILILLCFLGPEDPITKLRVVKEGLLTLSRKNGKTSLVAGIVAALMVLDKTSHGLVGGEIYVAASDRKQASILFDIVSKYILVDRTLGISKLFRMVPSRKHLTHTSTLTELEVLSSDAYRAHGLNPSIVVFDETGNVPAVAAAEFYGVLTSGYGAQQEPLTLLMSTQAPNDTHLFSQMVDRCKRINAKEEESLDVAGFVFETPEQIGKDKLDPHDEKLWYLSNPGLGPIVSIEDMRRESEKAKSLPSLEAKFRNLRLNQRSSPYSPLLSKSAWQKCGGEIDYEALYGRRCWGALDLSLVRDLTAYVLVFEDDDEGRTPCLAYFWLPGAGIDEKQREDKVPYRMWATQGFLNIDSATTVNFEIVAGQMQESMNDFDVQAIGYDRWKIDTVKAKLRDLGLGDIVDNEEFFKPIGQGFKDMSPCIDALEKSVLEEKLRHGDHPVLTWNASNAVSVSDPAGNRKLDKEKAYGRIDGIVALCMALRLKEIQSLGDEGPSSFEKEECMM